MVNINLSHCLYVLFFTFWHKMQGLIENGSRSQFQPTRSSEPGVETPGGLTDWRNFQVRCLPQTSFTYNRKSECSSTSQHISCRIPGDRSDRSETQRKLDLPSNALD